MCCLPCFIPPKGNGVKLLLIVPQPGWERLIFLATPFLFQWFFQRNVTGEPFPRPAAPHHLLLHTIENISLEEPRKLIISWFSPCSRLKPSGRVRGLDQGEKPTVSPPFAGPLF
jgi:hypothetical protein